jgi:hypothetical protein
VNDPRNRFFATTAVVAVVLLYFGQPARGHAPSQPPNLGDAPASGPDLPPVPSGAPSGNPPARSAPHDIRRFARPVASGDASVSPTVAGTSQTSVAPLLPVGYTLVDTVVSNTNTNLKNTDTWPDGEPSLAVNSGQIVISAFSSRWGNGNGAIFRSSNGGTTWTKSFSVPRPPGVAVDVNCPCDQVFDFDRSARLVGTVLNEAAAGGDVFTGATSNTASGASWLWRSVNGVASSTDKPRQDNADQPWLRVTRDPTVASQDNSYVGYDDFTAPADIRVSASRGANPPNFATTRVVGVPNCCVNPGTRLAVDHRNGRVYVLWQYATQNADGSVHVLYALNRSRDAGQTWALNGSTSGVVVAEANSNQPSPKFGTVNALLGGVTSIAVDNTSGHVYVAYGVRDPNTLFQRLAVAHLTPNTAGGLSVVSRRYLSGQFDAALPAVAVASNGTVGVLYDKYDGNNAAGFPVFSAHLAQSIDRAFSFTDVNLLAFASAERSTTNVRQRVLGDYQSLRSLGTTFYGAFTANGAQFGRSTSNMDAIFLKAPART